MRRSDDWAGPSVAIGTNWYPPNIVHKSIVPAGSSPTCYAPVEGRRNRRRFLPISLSLFALLGISGRDGKRRHQDCRGGNRSESFAQHYPLSVIRLARAGILP
jgi:hypothetical protein